jgi:hypothetical protein
MIVENNDRFSSKRHYLNLMSKVGSPTAFSSGLPDFMVSSRDNLGFTGFDTLNSIYA